MVLIAVLCLHCQSDRVIKGGTTKAGKQRYRCQNSDCPHYSFVLNPAYQGHLPESKKQIVDMALDGSGIRGTARVLEVSPTTVINELKKRVYADLGESAAAGATIAQQCRSGHMSCGCSRNG